LKIRTFSNSDQGQACKYSIEIITLVNPQIEKLFLSSKELERKARIWQALREASRNLEHNQGLHLFCIYCRKGIWDEFDGNVSQGILL